MRTFLGRVDRFVTALALAAAVAGSVVESACPWPRGCCANGDPALLCAASGSMYLAARGFARACRWSAETLRGLADPKPDPFADANLDTADRDGFAEGRIRRP